MSHPLIKPMAWAALALIAAGPMFAAETLSLEPLQGKWSTKRTSDDGLMVTHLIEIKDSTLTFKILASEDRVLLYARGTISTEKLGPFKVLKISDLQAGRSADEATAINDERIGVYVLGDGTLTLASNFDKERERQKPEALTYQRIAAPTAAATGSAADGKLVGKWKLEVKVAEDTRDYELQITKADGKLGATVTSPRSGEHKAKTVTYSDDKLVIEVDRDIQGNTATFIYTGKLTGEELGGTVVIKGFEEQYSGKWTAKK